MTNEFDIELICPCCKHKFIEDSRSLQRLCPRCQDDEDEKNLFDEDMNCQGDS